MTKTNKPPSLLYRFRALDSSVVFDRELKALEHSYLYSSAFGAMNDPMEAFYQIDELSKNVLESLFPKGSGGIQKVYNSHTEMIGRFALISFAESYDNLPMWAYYASGFAGMCLEFDAAELVIGDLQNEPLRPVEYAKDALPRLSLADILHEEANIARITRKRIEWAHEKEWRFVTGQTGLKHYVDDALRRVYLGPRINPAYAAQICRLLDKRPVEVLQGEIDGFDLKFRCLKPARQLVGCQRVSNAAFDPEHLKYFEQELRSFLKCPYETLITECNNIALRPNLKEISHAAISTDRNGQVYISTIFEMRNGRDVYKKFYYDENLNRIS